MTADRAPMVVFHSLRGTGHSLTVAAEGTSMLPLIQANDRIDVRFDPVDAFRPGDIVLFERGGRLILHRIVQRSVLDGAVVFFEKGDHQLSASPVPAAAALARVIRIRRGSRVFDLESRSGRWLRHILRWTSGVDAVLARMRRRWWGDQPTRVGSWWRGAGRAIRARLIRWTAGTPSAD